MLSWTIALLFGDSDMFNYRVPKDMSILVVLDLESCRFEE